MNTKARKQLRVQTLPFNRSGSARTHDHLMMTDVGTRPRNKGKGQWKHWTTPAVCKAAFAAPSTTTRQVAADLGGSARHTAKCRDVVANCILQGQRRGLDRLVAHSRVDQFSFWLVNYMFDETKLPVSVAPLGFRNTPVLARHSQVSWGLRGGTNDADVIREPVALRRAVSACIWPALSSNDDIGSLASSLDLRPDARYYGTLISCDSGSTNTLIVKHLNNQLPDNHLLLVSFCVQHRTGAVVKAATRPQGVDLFFLHGEHLQQRRFIPRPSRPHQGQGDSHHENCSTW